jgi:hypothetical protein
MDGLTTTMLKYEDILRKTLKVKNPALLKTGALGSIVNIFSHIKYDTAVYYQKLLRELNPATSTDFKSILFHSSILNYEINFALPAESLMSIIIPDYSIRSTELLTYDINRTIDLKSKENMNYTLEEDIKIYFAHNSVSAERITTNNVYPLEVNKIDSPSNPGESIYLIEYAGLKQYSRNIEAYRVPQYEIGEDISYSLDISAKEDIYEINAYIQSPTGNFLDIDSLYNYTSDELRNYRDLSSLPIKYNKYNANQFDKHIYLDIKDNQLTFNIGNGIHGKKLDAGSTILIETKLTKGNKGNVNSIDIVVPEVLITSTDTGGLTSTSKSNLKMLSTTGGFNGKDVDDIEYIRSEMIKKSSTRDSLVSINDFQVQYTLDNTAPFVDAKFFNSQNHMFIYNIIRDKYKKIVNTNTFTLPEDEFSQNLFFPEKEYAGEHLISPFYYKHEFNHYVAYMVKPLIEVKLIAPRDTNRILKLNNNINFQIIYDYFERKTKIRLINVNPLYTYKIDSNLLKAELTMYNNFEQVVNQRFLDQYCLFEEPIKDIIISIIDNDKLVMEYNSIDSYYQLVEKQRHFYYNEISRLDSTKQKKYILNIPYIDKQYLKVNTPLEVYTKLDRFFRVQEDKKRKAFNVDLTQSFFNTIDLPEKNKEFLIDANNNGSLLTAKNIILIEIIVDKYKFNLSNITSSEELEFKIKSEVFKVLSAKEGFTVDYYETLLENSILTKYNMINNIEVISPKLFSIHTSTEIYKNMEKQLGTGPDNLKMIDLVSFVPTYFYFDYDNINITLTFK